MKPRTTVYLMLNCVSTAWDRMTAAMHHNYSVNRELVINTTLQQLPYWYTWCCHTTGVIPTIESSEPSSLERTSLIIGGVLIFLIAVLIAVTLIIIVYIYMFAPRELYA